MTAPGPHRTLQRLSIRLHLRAFILLAGITNTLADPAIDGQWAGPFSWPLVSVHSTLLPNGKVLLYDDHTNNAGVQIWDPAIWPEGSGGLYNN